MQKPRSGNPKTKNQELETRTLLLFLRLSPHPLRPFHAVKLALISHGPPDDPKHFSGIPWHVLQELRRQGHVVETFHAAPADWARFWSEFKNRLSLKFSRQPHHVEADPQILRTRSARVAAQIRKFSPEAVLCAGFPEAAMALPESVPLFIWMDAFYPTLRRVYAYFRTYYGEADARILQQIEDRVLRRSRLIWLSSEWAATEARADFPEAARHIGVQSFGANLANPPTAGQVAKFISGRNLAEPTMLLLVNEWERKGGDTAVETVKRLRDRGFPAKLAVVGLKTKPAGVPDVSWIDWLGPLHKDNPDDSARLHILLSEAAFLLLPSVADCTPIVCHEAAAYGLPVLATNVGGIASTVTAGETAMLWSPERFADSAPPWMAAILADCPRYEKMAHAARRRYETAGNWEVNVRAVVTFIAANLSSS